MEKNGPKEEEKMNPKATEKAAASRCDGSQEEDAKRETPTCTSWASPG
jgi:hypothetical protein